MSFLPTTRHLRGGAGDSPPVIHCGSASGGDETSSLEQADRNTSRQARLHVHISGKPAVFIH